MRVSAARHSRRKRSAVQAGLALVAAVSLSSGNDAAAQSKFELQLRQIMADCGRPGYLLRPIAGKRLIITANPVIRQTPLSESDLRCISRKVSKLRGWKLLARDQR